MTVKNYLKLEFPSQAENIALARVAVAAFASQLDFTLPDLDDIRVAVSEAVTNVVVHAYANAGPGSPGSPGSQGSHGSHGGHGGPGKVFVEAEIGEDRVLTVRIADQGVGIADLEAARAAAGQGSGEHLGIGFSVMESCMDTLNVESESGRGTIVHLTKRAAGLPDGDES